MNDTQQLEERAPEIRRLAYSIAEACRVASIGKSSLYEAVNRGEIPLRKCGRKSLILAEDLLRWLRDLPIVTPDKAS